VSHCDAGRGGDRHRCGELLITARRPAFCTTVGWLVILRPEEQA
jgi:hypothetical protein